jgi:hypothetical protein
MNSFSEVENIIEEVSQRLDSFRISSPITVQTSPVVKRTDMCSLYQELAARTRKSNRMSVTPGPGQYFSSPITAHHPEHRIEGRPYIAETSSPGPVCSPDKIGDARFGYWPREPRSKQRRLEDSHLGPGTYDTSIRTGHRGHNIDAGKKDDLKTSELSLGPGQYMLREGYSRRGYTISKTKRIADEKFNPHLGPGKYEPTPNHQSANFKFSQSPRFDNSFQEKINSEG